MIRVFCTCGRAFKAEDRHAGKHTKCPECGASLTIGQAPKSGSGDGEDVPSWWYPRDPTAQDDRAPSPTRTGGDPDTDHTIVLPAANKSQGTPRAPEPFPSVAALGEVHSQASAKRPVSSKKVWTLAGATTALALLAVGAILWFRPAPPNGEEALPAPRGTELAKAGPSDPGKFMPSSAPKIELKAAENTIASKSIGDSSAGALVSKPRVDGWIASKSDGTTTSERLRLLVPAYIYPVGEGRKEWQRLIDAASKVEILAIANPSSGPGEERNLDYAAIFAEASNHGIKLLGYVSTDYGKRPKAAIKSDVDAWVRFYPQIRGFFFDQQPREGTYAPLFVELRDYAKQKLADPVVITNPGVACDASYFAQKTSNVTCVFVNYGGFDQFELPATLKAYDPSRFAALPYNISSAESMRNVVKDAIIKRIGYLYVSDAKHPNQWGKLPDYWEAEVDAVSRVQ